MLWCCWSCACISSCCRRKPKSISNRICVCIYVTYNTKCSHITIVSICYCFGCHSYGFRTCSLRVGIRSNNSRTISRNSIDIYDISIWHIRSSCISATPRYIHFLSHTQRNIPSRHSNIYRSFCRIPFHFTFHSRLSCWRKVKLYMVNVLSRSSNIIRDEY